MRPALLPKVIMTLAKLDMSTLSWCRIGEHLVFLDVTQDRYFCLRKTRALELFDRPQSEAIADWGQPDFLPRPADWQQPNMASSIQENSGFSLGRVAQALWLQRRIEMRLASKRFRTILEDHRRFVERKTSQAVDLSSSGVNVVRSFAQARLLRTSADRCLAQSIALSSNLAATGDLSRVVLGVSLHPFSAHCWVQKGATVLNESIEEVRRHTPILVV